MKTIPKTMETEPEPIRVEKDSIVRFKGVGNLDGVLGKVKHITPSAMVSVDLLEDGPGKAWRKGTNTLVHLYEVELVLPGKPVPSLLMVAAWYLFEQLDGCPSADVTPELLHKWLEEACLSGRYQEIDAKLREGYQEYRDGFDPLPKINR